jgi:hypothetical protein
VNCCRPVVGVVTPAESLQERLRHDAEATRVGLSTATGKASVSLADRDGDEVVNASARLKVPLAVGSLLRARVSINLEKASHFPHFPIGALRKSGSTPAELSVF